VKRWIGAVGAAVLAASVVGVVAAGPAGSSAFPGANGKIAFESDRDHNYEIYVMNPDGSGLTNVTNNPLNDRDPSWSADGEKIAFESDRDGGNYEIYVMNADGSGQTRLTTNSVTDAEPTWSPDGKKIAFESFQSGAWEIFVMNADGSGQTNVTNNGADDVQPTWSPDGKKIALSSNRSGNFKIWVMNADGSNLIALTAAAGRDFDPTWSPDGEQIAFSSDRSGGFEIWVMNADGSNATRLTDNVASAEDSQPAWSPDGKQITFASNRDGNFEVYVMKADGSGQTNLTNTGAYDNAPNWQPLERDGDVTVTKVVVGTPPAGTTFTVKVDCDGEQDDKTLTFGETGGTKSFERESFTRLECEVNEPGTGGATTVAIACADAENAECKHDGNFELFDDPGGDDTHVDITVTNTFPVVAEPTFTG